MKKSIQVILIILVAVLALKHYGWAFLISVLAIGFMIFFHELGHFLCALACGVRVRRFSVGFGQVLYAKRFKNTIYQIALIPLGGFVKLKGQSDLPAKNSDTLSSNGSYEQAALYKKIVILLAGPAFNLILGWLIFFAIGFASVQDVAPIVQTSENQAILKNDEILQINGFNIQGFSQIKKHIKEQNELLILRDNKKITVQAKASLKEQNDIFNKTQKVLLLGISSGAKPVSYKRSFLEVISYANDRSLQACELIFKSLYMLISAQQPISSIGGIISINDVTSSAVKVSWLSFGVICALISINLGIMNLLPIPVLDGGNIVLLCLSTFFSHHQTMLLRKYAAYVGLAFLIILTCISTYNDISRIFFKELL